MKKFGIIIGIICGIILAASVLGIITANQGRVESIEPDQLQELYAISAMPFPETPEGEAVDPTASHPKSDSLVQVLKKKKDDTLTGRLRVLEALTTKYESLEAAMVQEGKKRFTTEFDEELENRYVEDMTSYGVYREITYLTTWEKIRMFTMTYRSVMLVVGFLGMSLGIAIASSGTFRSDLDENA